MDGSFMSDFVEVIWRFYLDDHEIVEEIRQQLSIYRLKLRIFGKKFLLEGAKKIIDRGKIFILRMCIM